DQAAQDALGENPARHAAEGRGRDWLPRPGDDRGSSDARRGDASARPARVSPRPSRGRRVLSSGIAEVARALARVAQERGRNLCAHGVTGARASRSLTAAWLAAGWGARLGRVLQWGGG